MKSHLSNATGTVCGRGRLLANNVSRVTCLLCQDSDDYRTQLAEFKAKREAAFWAQEPTTVVPQFGRVNDDGVMDCYKCGGVLFRDRGRDLFNYNYECANCQTLIRPMTETGMST
jgi:hypothetical protein